MKLIVGLGNPGRRYEKTRHNVGFDLLDVLARRWSDGTAKDRFEGRLAEATTAGERLLLLWPHTWMNRSGASVQPALDYYRLTPDDLLVVCDDFNLPLGKLRFRSQGSAGGQKGLDDIIRRLGTQAFSRLRLGIGPVPEGWDPADFVLGKFTTAEREEISSAITQAADGVECWITEGIAVAMNQFN
jgi:peptidyl-tRNA hydrolase, PTH1 family